MRIFRKLAANRRGTSAMEFAFIAPVLALLIMGMTDLARGLAHRFRVEQASYRALEMVTSDTTLSHATIEAEADAAAGPQDDAVTITAWLECDGVVKAFTESCDPGDPDAVPEVPAEQTARFIKVEIISEFEPMFSYGPIGTAFGGNENGKVQVTARNTLRIQ